MNIIGRLFFQFLKVVGHPADGFINSLVQTNHGLPSQSLPCLSAVEQVGRIFARPVTDDFNCILKFDAQLLTNLFDDIADG